ncbi:MAG: CPBP family intramembrane metalloprotease [Muribaculaceae bacterium]|nr:CPBP family intramembrane metalloprotease [Muribaculaceae bacterium]
MKRFIDICQFVLVLLGLALCGLFVTASLGFLPIKGNALQWTIFAGQNILAFIIPSMLMWKICFGVAPLKAIEAEKCPPIRMIGIALLIYFVGMPALNQTVYWNQEMQLPEFLSSFDEWCRNLEKLAEEQTSGLLNSTALFPTAMNLLVIGVLTGIGEEFFFRGALQRGLVWCKVNPHIAIWVTAFIFSAVHFQFFGFVPRMLLGAFFGYLYWWSGNIWVNAFTHALNNSLVIISTWCVNRGMLSEEFDMMGVSDSGIPTCALISMLAVAGIICILSHRGVLKGQDILPPELPSNTIENATESK